MSVLIAGIGRSGTSTLFEVLGAAYLRLHPDCECYYEPLLWSVPDALKTGRVKGTQFSTENLDPFGVYAHTSVPLFTAGPDPVLGEWINRVFGPPELPRWSRVVKEIRGMGRIEAILRARPNVRCILLTRNPLDTVNSSLGMFSFFGEEFHRSDKARFMLEVERRDGPQTWPEEEDLAGWAEIYLRKFTEAGLDVARRMPDRILVLPYETYSLDKVGALKRVYDFLELGDLGDEAAHLDRAAGPVTTARNLSLRSVQKLAADTGQYVRMLEEFDFAGALNPALTAQLLDRYSARRSSGALVARESMARTGLQWRLRSADLAKQLERARGEVPGADAVNGAAAAPAANSFFRDWLRDAVLDKRILPRRNVGGTVVTREPLPATCIVSAYNSEATLEHCITSVMAQTRPYEQVIIADDASTDGTYELSQSLLRKYPTLRYQRRSVNVGPSGNRDLAIRSIETVLFSQVDADDSISPIKHEQESAVIVDPLQDIAYSDIELLTQKGASILDTSDYSELTGAHAFAAIITRRWPVPRDMLLSGSLYRRAGGFEYFVSMYEDWRLKLRLCRTMQGQWRHAGGGAGTSYDRRAPGLSGGTLIRHAYWQLDAVGSVLDLVDPDSGLLAQTVNKIVSPFKGRLNRLPDRFAEECEMAPPTTLLRTALKKLHAAVRMAPSEEDMFRAVFVLLQSSLSPALPPGRPAAADAPPAAVDPAVPPDAMVAAHDAAPAQPAAGTQPAVRAPRPAPAASIAPGPAAAKDGMVAPPKTAAPAGPRSAPKPAPAPASPKAAALAGTAVHDGKVPVAP